MPCCPRGDMAVLVRAVAMIQGSREVSLAGTETLCDAQCDAHTNCKVILPRSTTGRKRLYPAVTGSGSQGCLW